MPFGASCKAVYSIYQPIHIYGGFRLMNPVFIIIHIHSVFKYHISITISLSYYFFKDILNLCTYFIYSFTYTHACILIHIFIHLYSFIYSLMHTYSYIHSCILIHILIHVYSFIYSFTYTHSYTHSCVLINI